VTDRLAAVRTMLGARSVAVVGASPRPNSFGEMMLLELTRSGYDGAVYPVNPKYDEILGSQTYPSLADLPGPVDLAVLGVGNHLIEGQMQLAADAGARSAAIFASCYEDPEPGKPSLPSRLSKIAKGAGMAVVGGNCMGFLNLDTKLRVCGFVETGLEARTHHVRHAPGVGVLGGGMERPRTRVQPDRVGRPGDRHHDGRVHEVRALAAEHKGSGAVHRDDPRTRALQGGASRGGREGHPGGRSEGWA